MAVLKSIFSKMPMMKILFPCSVIRARMKSSVAMLKPVKVKMNVRNTTEVIFKVKNGYVVQYVINGIMKIVFYE